MSRVSSSNIANVEWDKDTKELTVQFVNGAIYGYDQVPEEIYKALISAPSAGQYLNQYVKGQFNYRRIA